MRAMKSDKPHTESADESVRIHPELCSEILKAASRGMPRQEFLPEIADLLLKFTGSDVVGIRIVERDRLWSCEASLGGAPAARLDIVQGRITPDGRILPCLEVESDFETLCEAVVLNRLRPSSRFVTRLGNFYAGDISRPIDVGLQTGDGNEILRIDVSNACRTLAIYRFKIDDKDDGLLFLKSKKKGFFTAIEVASYQHTAKVLGVASTQRRMRIAFRERVKELTCLYGLAKVAATPGLSLEQVLQHAVELLPQGWLHSDAASAVIVFDGRSYATTDFRDSPNAQTADIMIDGKKRGAVRVVYSKDLPELDEGPFLTAERELLNAIANEIALIIGSRQTERERESLQEQLRHADRLATIGQLAAGVAHELNEPLASILGRAQLVGKVSGLPDQVREDAEKIVTASLYAREIINKLRLFARHAPPRQERVDLNDIVHDGLFLLQPRCDKAGITLIKNLEPGLPRIVADPGQLYQVLINLAVNALQATPDGGRITIQTRAYGEHVGLRVEDTGAGMTEEVLKQIFTPFFTTKEAHEGTGLGLAVVHGIVKSHGGAITVHSDVGKGSCFEVMFPVESPDDSNP